MSVPGSRGAWNPTEASRARQAFGSVISIVQAGFGVGFISRRAVEGELAAGLLAEARVAGLDVTREISLVRGAGRSATRAAEAFVAFARERLD